MRALIVSVVCGLIATAFIVAPVSAHAYLCAVGHGASNVQVNLYNFDNQTGNLGFDCNDDPDYANGIDSTFVGLSNLAESMVLTGVVGETWCVVFYDQPNYVGPIFQMRVHNGQDLHVDMAAVLDNRFQSHKQIQLVFGSACT